MSVSVCVGVNFNGHAMCLKGLQRCPILKGIGLDGSGFTYNLLLKDLMPAVTYVFVNVMLENAESEFF